MNKYEGLPVNHRRTPRSTAAIMERIFIYFLFLFFAMGCDFSSARYTAIISTEVICSTGMKLFLFYDFY